MTGFGASASIAINAPEARVPTILPIGRVLVRFLDIGLGYLREGRRVERFLGLGLDDRFFDLPFAFLYAIHPFLKPIFAYFLGKPAIVIAP
jgi:hypothetical protein